MDILAVAKPESVRLSTPIHFAPTAVVVFSADGRDKTGSFHLERHRLQQHALFA
jgi:hypothetical protein